MAKDVARAAHQAVEQTADQTGMELLASHVPLSLLIDLAAADGPDSRVILVDELPTGDDLTWLSARGA